MEYNDYPLEQCADVAFRLIERGASIHQKWTCGHCGSRQTMAVPNKFFRAGQCEECGEFTTIARCNYLVVSTFGGAR